MAAAEAAFTTRPQRKSTFAAAEAASIATAARRVNPNAFIDRVGCSDTWLATNLGVAAPAPPATVCPAPRRPPSPGSPLAMRSDSPRAPARLTGTPSEEAKLAAAAPAAAAPTAAAPPAASPPAASPPAASPPTASPPTASPLSPRRVAARAAIAASVDVLYAAEEEADGEASLPRRRPFSHAKAAAAAAAAAAQPVVAPAAAALTAEPTLTPRRRWSSMSSAELPAEDLSGGVVGSGQAAALPADGLAPQISEQVAQSEGRAIPARLSPRCPTTPAAQATSPATPPRSPRPPPPRSASASALATPPSPSRSSLRLQQLPQIATSPSPSRSSSRRSTPSSRGLSASSSSRRLGSLLQANEDEDEPTPTAARLLSPVDSEGSAVSVMGLAGRICLLDAPPDAVPAGAPAAAPATPPLTPSPAGHFRLLDAALAAAPTAGLDAAPDAVPDAPPGALPAAAPPRQGAAPPRRALGEPVPSGAGPSKHCAAHENVQRWASEQSTDQLQSNLASLRKRSYAASGRAPAERRVEAPMSCAEQVEACRAAMPPRPTRKARLSAAASPPPTAATVASEAKAPFSTDAGVVARWSATVPAAPPPPGSCSLGRGWAAAQGALASDGRGRGGPLPPLACNGRGRGGGVSSRLRMQLRPETPEDEADLGSPRWHWRPPGSPPEPPPSPPAPPSHSSTAPASVARAHFRQSRIRLQPTPARAQLRQSRILLLPTPPPSPPSPPATFIDRVGASNLASRIGPQEQLTSSRDGDLVSPSAMSPSARCLSYVNAGLAAAAAKPPAPRPGLGGPIGWRRGGRQRTGGKQPARSAAGTLGGAPTAPRPLLCTSAAPAAAPAAADAAPGTPNFLTHLPRTSSAESSPAVRRFSRAKTGDASPAAAAGTDRPGVRRKSSILRSSPSAGRLLSAAKQTQAQKAAAARASLWRATTFKRTDSGRIEIATAGGLKRRVCNFVRRVVSGFRSEHTIGSFLYPQDVEVASLTDPQIGQIFWNMVRCIARPLGAPARTPTVHTLHMLASLQTGLRCWQTPLFEPKPKPEPEVEPEPCPGAHGGDGARYALRRARRSTQG